jgi:hypothetical protein
MTKTSHTYLFLTQVKTLQIHEPILVTSAGASLKESCTSAYSTLAAAAAKSGVAQLQLVTYYDDLEEDVYRWVVQLPVSAVQLDFLGVSTRMHECS